MEGDEKIYLLKNVDTKSNVVTLAELKKKREILLQKKKMVLNSRQNKIITAAATDQTVVFLAPCETSSTFTTANSERSFDDNDNIEQRCDPKNQPNGETPSIDFENVLDFSSESLIHLSDITNVMPIELSQSIIDQVYNPESELDDSNLLIPVNTNVMIVSTSPEETDLLDQRAAELPPNINSVPMVSTSPEDLVSQKTVGPAPNMDSTTDSTPLASTLTDGNIESFPEQELEPACSRESRKRQRKANPENTKRSRNKRLRMNGKQYVGFRKVPVADDNDNHYRQDSIKPARTLGETCGSSKCLKSQNIHCEKFTESVRRDIFETFWKLNWQEKKIFVCSMVDIKQTERKTKGKDSRRNATKIYNLKLDEQRERVCLKTFIRTLGIKEWTVRYWLGENPTPIRATDAETTLDSTTRANTKALIRTFLRSLPKLPSHYCRKDSTKLYLEPLIQSKRELYRIYVKNAQMKSEKFGCRKLFEDTLKDENIAIFKPKKDACDLCCSYKAGNVSEEAYLEHISRKDLARKEKAEDKVAAKNGTVHVITADLQSVKLCPYLTASALYFKTKLMVHNFTVYNLGNEQVVCYWFDETTADLKATTYANFYVDYIKKILHEDPKDFIIYTDGCTCQNRNTIVSNALLRLAMNTNVTITQKFLEKGHTQMEVDSVHSVIERKLKHREIYLPSQYASVTKEARLKPSPYEVIMPNYTFFKDFGVKKELIYESIRPGRGAGAKCVVDIRVLKYNPDGTIEYKLNYGDEFNQLPRTNKKSRITQPISTLPQLFFAPLPIPKTKYDHLQQLKEVIPKDCHEFYDKLQFKN